MSTPIEAQSLSDLTQLLANPPQYPRNPTHQVRPPLVLYIVRVPGSKDVFLTPLKPPTKASISLESIQSSLYYLHVAVPGDEVLKRTFDEQRQIQNHENLLPPVIRKPLPPAPLANHHPRGRSISPPKNYPQVQQGFIGSNSSQTSGRAARGSHLRLNTTDEQDTQITRKPIPSRISRQSTHSEQEESLVQGLLTHVSGNISDQSKWSPQARKPLQSAGSLVENDFQRPEAERHSFQTTRTFDENNHYFANSSPSGLLHAGPRENNIRPAEMSVTLIRRDPVSGSQWNVGTISVLQNTFVDSNLHPVSVELHTPGYGRFARHSEMVRPGTTESDAASVRSAFKSAFSTPTTPTVGDGVTSAFTRILDFRPLSPASNQSRPEGYAYADEVSARIDSAPKKPIRNTYSFLSPWHGVCTFSNGIDGKSLRCKHTLPLLGSEDGAVAVNVAEVRFNLPWSIITRKNVKRDAENEGDRLPISTLLDSKKQTFRRSMQQLKHKSWNSRSHERDGRDILSELRSLGNNGTYPKEHEADRLSLKLGREKAGGGFKGDRAKLGKLIIDDEGFKMCDLVVAACMGVWWQHYNGLK